MFNFLSSSAVKASLAALREPKTPAQAKRPPIGSSSGTKPSSIPQVGLQPNQAATKNAKRRKLLPPADIPLGKLWPAEGGPPQDRFSLTAHKVSSLAWPEEASSSSSVQNKREDVLAQVNSLLGDENTSSTLKSYESLLRTEVRGAEDDLQVSLIPLDTEAKFLTLFGWVATNNANLKWSRVKALKAALSKYHKLKNMPTILGQWSSPMAALWKGLSKHASHDSSGKTPVSFQAVHDYLSAQDKSITDMRNKAMVCVSFFGVRRSAETRAFCMEHVSISDKGISLRVTCQKNDQLGLGMTCFIPHIASMKERSPATIIKEWIAARPKICQSTSDPESLLFITTTGKKKTIGGPVSADSFRKFVSTIFGSGKSTHSLRKGGATFLARNDAPAKVTQAQGGWRTTEVMQNIYTNFSVEEQQQAISQAADKGAGALQLWPLCSTMPVLTPLNNKFPTSRDCLTFLRETESALSSPEFPWKTAAANKLGMRIKILSQHECRFVRIKAISVYTNMRKKFQNKP